MRKATRGLITVCAGLVAGAAFGAGPALAAPGTLPSEKVFGYYGTWDDCHAYGTSLTIWDNGFNCEFRAQRASLPYVLIAKPSITVIINQPGHDKRHRGDSDKPTAPAPDVKGPGPSVPGPDVPGPDVPGPDVPAPNMPGPDMPGPDAGQPAPAVPGPDVPAPDAGQPAPAVPGPDVPAPDAGQPAPAVPGPDVPAPNVPGPNVPGPDVPAPDAGQPASNGSGSQVSLDVTSSTVAHSEPNMHGPDMTQPAPGPALREPARPSHGQPMRKPKKIKSRPIASAANRDLHAGDQRRNDHDCQVVCEPDQVLAVSVVRPAAPPVVPVIPAVPVRPVAIAPAPVIVPAPVVPLSHNPCCW